VATLTDDILSLMTGGKQSFAPAQTSQATAAPDYSGLVSSAEQRYGLPQGLLSRLIFKGERSGATAVSPKGAVGLGQLMPGTARDMGVTDPTDPAQNIDGSARYLAQMLQHYNGDQKLAVAAYNAGPATVDQYGGVPPYKETQGEVARVIGAQPDAGQSTGGADILSLATGGKQSFATAPAPNAQPKQMDANAPQSSAEFLNNANLAYRAANIGGDAPVGAQVFEPNPNQAKTLRQMDAAGMIDRSVGALGTAKQPYVMQSADNDTSALGPGVFYVDWQGKLQQTAGKPITTAEGAEAGGTQGVSDVGTSVLQGKMALANKLLLGGPSSLPDGHILGMALMAPDMVMKAMGMKDTQDVVNNALVQRNIFDARYGHNGVAGVSRIGGNIAASAPLMATGEGALAEAGPVGQFLVGKAGGNLLIRGASLASKGALEGAEASGLTSSGSDAPVGQQIASGAGLGAILGLAAPAAKGVAGAVGDMGNSLFAPLSDAGQNKIVRNFVADRAAGGPSAINAVSEIPGVQRTLAQSTGNVGIAALERSARNTPGEFSNTFDQLMRSNNEARQQYFKGLSGDENDLQALKDARDAAAMPLRQQAFAAGNADRADPQPVIAEIDKILQSPSGQRDVVQSALGNIRDKLVSVGKDGKPTFQTDPEQLYGIRQAIGDKLNPLAQGTDSDKRLASAELIQVRDAIDKSIEDAAPGFKDYLSKYADLSKPVDEAQYLQSLKLVGPNDHMTLGKVDNAITQIEKLRAKPGANPAKSISDQTMKSLYTLRDDLRQEDFSNQGRGPGSNTAQNLATAGLTNALTGAKFATVPLAVAGGLLGGATHGAEGAGVASGLGAAAGQIASKVYEAKNAQIHNKLLGALLDPNFNVSIPAGTFAKHKVVAPFLQNQLIPASVLAQRSLMPPSPDASR
jgi:hypothetical protein